MKRYIGGRTVRHIAYVHIKDDDAPFGRALDPHEDRLRSGSAYEWGYSGLGTSQLAFALLCEHLSDAEYALRAARAALLGEETHGIAPLINHLEFATRLRGIFEPFVERLADNGWEITDIEIAQSLERILIHGEAA